MVEPDVHVRAVDDDPDDDVFLQWAGSADHVVSGDITDLGSDEGIPILTPDGFLTRLEDRYRDR